MNLSSFVPRRLLMWKRETDELESDQMLLFANANIAIIFLCSGEMNEHGHNTLSMNIKEDLTLLWAAAEP